MPQAEPRITFHDPGPRRTKTAEQIGRELVERSWLTVEPIAERNLMRRAGRILIHGRAELELR